MQKTGERGEFLPITDSLFGYNETIAQRYLPLTAQEAKNLNYPWQEEESIVSLPQGVEAISAESLPKNIEEIGEDILDKILLCKKTKRPYRITKQEFTFYKKHGIPLPQYHQDERKKMLLERGMGEIFELKNCENCQKTILYVTHGGVSRKIYCKECYEKLM